MAEILDLEQTLAMLKGFTPLQRILLAQSGTLQTALSAYFGEPVDVKVVSQEERDAGETFLRDVELVLREQRQAVCRAHTRIEVRNEQARKLIRERNVGLGQLCEKLGLRATFALDAAGSTDASLWREYRLEGPGFCYFIREELPAALYEEDHGGRRP